VDAIRAGAKEYLPLPADPELIAAVLAAVADESHQLVYEDEAMGAVSPWPTRSPVSEASILSPAKAAPVRKCWPLCPSQIARADKPFISVNCAAIPGKPAGIGIVRP
jgi:DNA-binding NtrC family response regulator